MALITKYHTFVDGAGVPNAQCLAVRLNTNWDRLYTLVNGGLDQENMYAGYKLTRSGALPVYSNGTHEGILWYDTGANKMYYGNDTAWHDSLGPTGARGPAGTAGAAGAGSAKRTFTWVIMNPVAGVIGGPCMNEENVVKKITAATKDGTSVVVTPGIAAATDPFTSTAEICPAVTADSDSQVYDMTGASGENATVDAGEWIILTIGTVTGAVTQLVISVSTEVS